MRPTATIPGIPAWRALTSLLLVMLCLGARAQDRDAPPYTGTSREEPPRSEPGEEGKEPREEGSGGLPLPPSGRPVGAIQAALEVGATGAALYSVPIKVPPGIRGIEPRLSLAYNSMGGQDIAGIGMSVSGLSMIERCAATRVRDGAPGAVKIDAGDRFCVDGLRLKVQGKTGYGEPGAVYRTEGETWTRFTSKGTCGTGPCSFAADLKNGNKVVFGGEGAEGCGWTRAEDASASRYHWPLTRLTDLNGNDLTVTWREGGVGYCIPDTIRYTGNTVEGAAPLREVHFGYMPRSDVESVYVGGYERYLAALLQSVSTWLIDPITGDARMVQRYLPEYEYSPWTHRSRMTSLTLCDAAGQCLPETTFQWQQGDWITQEAEYERPYSPWVFPNANNPSFLMGDFDASGRMDFLFATDPGVPGGSGYLLRDAPGNHEPVFTGAYYGSFNLVGEHPDHYDLGDFNGDGASDLLHVRWLLGGDTEWSITLGGPGGLADSFAWIGNHPWYERELRVGDFDADGRSDVLTWLPYTGKWWLALWKGDHFEETEGGTFFPQWPAPIQNNPDPKPYDSEPDPGSQPPPEPLPVYQQVMLGEFDGDGRVDLLTFRSTTTSGWSKNNYIQWRIYRATGAGFGVMSEGEIPGQHSELNVADFNGDGLSDVLVIQSSGYTLLYGTGKGLELYSQAPYQMDFWPVGSCPQVIGSDCYDEPETLTWGMTGDNFGLKDRVEVANFNDDGRADLLVSASSRDPEVAEAVENGDGWMYADASIYVADHWGLDWVAYTTLMPDLPHILGDFYGTGRTTLYTSSDQYAHYHFSGLDKKPDLLIGVVDGIDGGWEVEYSSMMDHHLYTRGQGAVYPVRDITSSHYLVQRVTRTDGLGGEYTSSHTYTGARTDLSGWGFLGFAETWVKYSDERSITTLYHQNPPFHGMPHTQTLSVAPQEKTVTSWTWINQPDPAAKGTHQLLKQKEEVSEYSTLNTLLHTSRKSWVYDTWGNVLIQEDRADINQSWTTLITNTTWYSYPNTWTFGYPKTVDVFDSANQRLSGTFYEYDARMNPAYEARWINTTGTWLGSHKHFDAWGRMDTSTTPAGAVSTWSYDDWGLPEGVLSPLGHQESRRVDPAFGVDLSTTDSAGAVTERTYDGFGRPLTVALTNPAGATEVVTRYERIDPGVGMVVQSQALRDWGGVEWDWEERWLDGMAREYLTRKRGEVSRAILAEKEYYNEQLVWRSSLPYYEGDTPLWTETSHDPRRRPLEIVGPDATSTWFEYDDAQRKITRHDPDGAVTELFMSARGKMIQRVDPGLASTTWGYDGLGRLTHVLAPGASTVTTWDSIGRKVSVVDSTTGTTSFTYAPTGELLHEIDAKGQKIERVWDAMDRTELKRIYRAGETTPSRLVDLAYDDSSLSYGVGRLTSVEIKDGSAVESRYTFAYDAQGHQRMARLDTLGKSFVWGGEFTPSGETRELIYPDGSRLRSAHTPGGRLRSLALFDDQDPGAGWVEHARYAGYDASGKPRQVIHANGVVTCYGWDAATQRLDHSLTGSFAAPDDTTCDSGASPVKTLSEQQIAWDDAGRILNIFQLDNPALSQSFTYTERGYLESAEGPYGLRSYDYDAAGNLTLKDGVVFTVAGQKLASSSDGTTYHYDANGNLDARTSVGGSITYGWDPEDMLVLVDNNGQLTRSTFDFAGNRLTRLDPDGRLTWYVGGIYEVTVGPDGAELHTKYVPGPGGKIVQITHAGDLLAARVQESTTEQHAAMMDLSDPRGMIGAGRALAGCWVGRPELPALLLQALLGVGALGAMALASRALARRGTQLSRRTPAWAGIAPLIALALGVAQVAPPHVAQAMSPGASGEGIPEVGTYYLHQSHNLSTVLVTDKSGQLESRVDYEPWGEVMPSSPGTDHFRPKFTGAELDSGAGLYHVGERAYDPSLGRFLRADRGLGADPLQTVSLNRYAWCTNNPVTVVDPTGRFAVGVFIAVVALFAIAGALIGGTDGKILTDPHHAFDSWSWHRAAFGFWVGMWAGIVAYGMGTIGAGVMIFGVKASTVAVSMYIGGLTNLLMAYARGETDGAKLAGYFGVGMVAGLVAATGFGAVAELGLVGKAFAQTAASVLNSSLKLMIDGGQAVQITVWAFAFTFQGGKLVDWTLDPIYLAGFVVSGLARAWYLDKSVQLGWTWNPGIADSRAREELGSLYNMDGDWFLAADKTMFSIVGKVAANGIANYLRNTGMDFGDLGFARDFLTSGLGADFFAGAAWGALGPGMD